MKTPKPRIYHSHDLRKGRVSLSGQIYSITTVTLKRQTFFHDFTVARALIQILREHDALDYAKTICFVVMPDHLHWLMQLGNNRDLATVVRGMKSLSSKRSGCKLWQHGFYDHALRHDENVKTVSRYIVMNPVRAGLVEHHNDYPHWDAIWM